MAVRSLFAGLESYKLTGVQFTNRELGHGSYATVLELEYMGLKCAGKKIHEILLRQGDTSYSLRRFKEECHLLSQVRHPNIVQFLGVHFQEGEQAPILVMEFLPTNLTSCIEQYGILPKEFSYSILHHVALGLHYLHNQTPPIIHRDLSSNNILLTPSMTAKISDLGVARILNLTPLQVSRMTQTPGTPAYMPPEVMIANPKYDTSVDEFSYGILMIHMFSGRWPEPQVGPVHTEPGKMIPVSEAKRREVFLQEIGDDHPLMNLIMKCINNHPQSRAHTEEIVKQLAEMVIQFSDNEQNMTRRDIEMSYCSILSKESGRNGERIKKKRASTVDLTHTDLRQLKIAYSSEIALLKSKLRDTDAKFNLYRAENEAKVMELKSKAALDETQMENKDRILLQKRKQFETQLAKEREGNKRLIVENRDLQSKIDSLQHANSVLQSNIVEKDNTIARREATNRRKDLEIEAKTTALREKDAIISELSEHLTKAREYLATNQSASYKIVWKKCFELPIKMNRGKALIINGKVYCGGGNTDGNDMYTVYCYNLLQDNWSSLPPLPVRLFGLGEIGGKLVAVGGNRKSDDKISDVVYTYYEDSLQWKQIVPPMPTARWFPGILSQSLALIVAGGFTPPGISTNIVEIFQHNTSQWYKTDPVPVSQNLLCCDMSLASVGNICYVLGGSTAKLSINEVQCASVDDLLHHAIPATADSNQTVTSNNNAIHSAWKTLPNTPTYGPTAATLAGNLLTIGGNKTAKGETNRKEVHMYSPSINSWIYVSDLPAPRSCTAVTVLSPAEILVIGGRGESDFVNTVYKGTLHLEL